MGGVPKKSSKGRRVDLGHICGHKNRIWGPRKALSTEKGFYGKTAKWFTKAKQGGAIPRITTFKKKGKETGCTENSGKRAGGT